MPPVRQHGSEAIDSSPGSRQQNICFCSADDINAVTEQPEGGVTGNISVPVVAFSLGHIKPFGTLFKAVYHIKSISYIFSSVLPL